MISKAGDSSLERPVSSRASGAPARSVRRTRIPAVVALGPPCCRPRGLDPRGIRHEMRRTRWGGRGSGGGRAGHGKRDSRKASAGAVRSWVLAVRPAGRIMTSILSASLAACRVNTSTRSLTRARSVWPRIASAHRLSWASDRRPCTRAATTDPRRAACATANPNGSSFAQCLLGIGGHTAFASTESQRPLSHAVSRRRVRHRGWPAALPGDERDAVGDGKRQDCWCATASKATSTSPRAKSEVRARQRFSLHAGWLRRLRLIYLTTH